MLPNTNPARGLSAIRSILRQAKLDLNFARNEVLDPRITFSRTSNATRTNSQGLIEYAPHNLLTYSEQFDNAVWIKSNATVIANAVVAPDSTLTADNFMATAVSGEHVNDQLFSTLIGATYTASCLVKANGLNDIGLRFTNASLWAGTATPQVRFNLTTKTASVVTGNPSNYDLVDIGNGYYRISMSVVCIAAGVAGFRLQLMQGTSNVFTGDGTSGMYIWGAQLNIGSLQPYYTTSVKNLLGYSQNFENAAWTKSNSSIDATPVMGPLGFLGAEKLVENTAAGVPHGLAVDTSSLNSTTQYTFSVYAKAGERTWVRLGLVDNLGTDGGRAWFDLSNGVVGTVETNGAGSNINATINSIGAGWYRCRFTAQMNNSKTTLQSQVRLATANNVLTYTGDGSSGIYIFGAQLSDSASLDQYSYNFGAAPTSSAYYGPRFDYDPVTLAPKGLLIEEQRINILLNSDTLSTQSVSVTAQAYTLSFYGTGSIALSGTYTGTLVGTGVYPNRVQLTFTPAIGTLTLTVTGSVRYANLEAGSFPTSYIPTTSAQVTRTADNASMVGTNFSSWYNQSEGTVAVGYDRLSNITASGVPRTYSINDGTLLNEIDLRQQSGSGEYFAIAYAGASQASIANIVVTAGNSIKTASSYATNNVNSATNTILGVNDNLATIPSVTRLDFGNRFDGLRPLNGHIQSFKFFSKRFLDTYLQRLTQ